MRRLWCALVGCQQQVARGGVTPDGQQLPDWLSWSDYTTTIDGRRVTTGSIVQVPQTYYGPSIPLNSDWTYGGSSSPTASTSSSGSSSFPTSTGSTSGTTETTSGSQTLPSSGLSSTQSTAASSSPAATLSSSQSPTTGTTTPSTVSTSPTSLTSSLTSGSAALTSSSPTTSQPSSSTLPSSLTSRTTTSPSFFSSSFSSSSSSSFSSSSSSSFSLHATPTTQSPASTSTAVTGIVPHSNNNVKTIVPAVILPIVAVIVLILLLLWCLKRRRQNYREERSFKNARWAPVATGEHFEKPQGDGGAGGPAAITGVAGAAAATATEKNPFVGEGEETGSAGHGDEQSSLLHEHERDPGFVTAGMAPTGGAIAGVGLLRSLGIGRRPSYGSSRTSSSSTRSISGNTMEKVIGLVGLSPVIPSGSTQSQDRSTSGGTTGQTRSTSGTTTDAKRSSGGTSTGAYVPIGDDDLFFAVPRPFTSSPGTSSPNDSEAYFTAGSYGDSGNSGSTVHVRGEHGSLGSNSGSSSEGSRRSGRSKASSGRGSGRGVTGRVHSTIPEEAAVIGGTAAVAAAGAAFYAARRNHSDRDVYDLGQDTASSSSPSQYDSAGSGSATDGSGGSGGPNRLSMDVTEFGQTRPRRRDRRFPPTTEVFTTQGSGGRGGTYAQSNLSVGTFGTLEDESRPSLEFHSVPQGPRPPLAAPVTGTGPDNTSTFGSITSGYSGGSGSVHDRPSLDRPSLELALLGHSRTNSGDRPFLASVRKRSMSSSDRPLPPVPPTAYSPSKMAVRSEPHLLRTSMGGVRREGPGPLPRPPLPSAIVGGDMMLSPFGPGRDGTTPLSSAQKQQQIAAQQMAAQRDAKALQRNSLSPGAGASRSVGDLSTSHPSEAASSFDVSSRRGSAPRLTVYDEFGMNVTRPESSRSVPTLFGPHDAGYGTTGSGNTSGSSQLGSVSEVADVNLLGTVIHGARFTPHESHSSARSRSRSLGRAIPGTPPTTRSPLYGVVAARESDSSDDLVQSFPDPPTSEGEHSPAWQQSPAVTVVNPEEDEQRGRGGAIRDLFRGWSRQ